MERAFCHRHEMSRFIWLIALFLQKITPFKYNKKVSHQWLWMYEKLLDTELHALRVHALIPGSNARVGVIAERCVWKIA